MKSSRSEQRVESEKNELNFSFFSIFEFSMLPSSSSALAAAASLALRRASSAAAGVSSGREIASALADLLPASRAALGGTRKSVRRSISTSSSTSSSTTSPNPSPPLPPSAREDFAYCADLVRKRDPENYLWVSELPREQRAVALALRAFNVETATAADAASAHSRKAGVPTSFSSSSSSSAADHQAALASARLQWWKEAVAEAVSGKNALPNHPVARALAAVAASGAVSPRSLSARLARVAAARADDATQKGPPGTMKDLEAYGEATAAQLLYLQLEAATAGTKDGSKNASGSGSGSGSGSSADADRAASHLGRAAAISSLLRGLRSHAENRRCYLPVSELERAGTSARELFEAVEGASRARAAAGGSGFDFPDPLREATRAVASAAMAHLTAARGLAGRLPKGAAPCLLQSVSVARHLALLEENDFDPLAAEAAVSSSSSAGEAGSAAAAAAARHRAALAVETRWRRWRGTF